MTDARWNWYGEGEDQPLEVRRSKVLDQEEKARKGMNTPNIYKAKFWIFEEKRYGTWEESQEFYRNQDKEQKRIRAASVANSLSREELAAVRDRLVAEG